eukprot:5809797-Pleurochrysis_carterae.AAC.1
MSPMSRGRRLACARALAGRSPLQAPKTLDNQPRAPLERDAGALRNARASRQVDHAEIGCRRTCRPSRHDVGHAQQLREPAEADTDVRRCRGPSPHPTFPPLSPSSTCPPATGPGLVHALPAASPPALAPSPLRARPRRVYLPLPPPRSSPSPPRPPPPRVAAPA